MIRHSATYWINLAYREGWALGMFNAHHLEAIQAIADAAAKLSAPLMLSMTMGGMRHVGLDYFVAMAEVARRRCAVPLILHLDHGANYEAVRDCIEAGFDSVMIDASSAKYDENVELVRKVVALAHRYGVGVEAQIGETLAEEGGEIIEVKTTVDEAVAFVHDTNVDYLAVSIGNTPGVLGTGAPIDVDLTKRLSAAVGIPLVLHGGTSVPPEVVREIVAAGVAKVNIDSAVKGGFRTALMEAYRSDNPIVDTRVPMARGRELAQAAVEERIRLFGAEKRAL
ncbi:class II fructose-bisphosphate aldolase [Telmatospirillum sp.]|uniref:class II fructose-bisphosphate aldolase n=1 Tax=Telmatospirillum sp. TaxID=2079197 RepID=UPI002851BF40|nr:class II fructose-bisphosphate aldolase [Telmatospirillum sp.]MDR3440126.1 class II fructose-bisphosphate aldolase [Telmatospirillum sp.]